MAEGVGKMLALGLVIILLVCLLQTSFYLFLQPDHGPRLWRPPPPGLIQPPFNHTGAPKINVCLTLFGSFDQVDLMVKSISHWPGNVVLAVWNREQRPMPESLSALPPRVIVKWTVPEANANATVANAPAPLYPVDEMRQISKDAVPKDNFPLLLDVNFLPSVHLSNYIQIYSEFILAYQYSTSFEVTANNTYFPTDTKEDAECCTQCWLSNNVTAKAEQNATAVEMAEEEAAAASKKEAEEAEAKARKAKEERDAAIAKAVAEAAASQKKAEEATSEHEKADAEAVAAENKAKEAAAASKEADEQAAAAKQKAGDATSANEQAQTEAAAAQQNANATVAAATKKKAEEAAAAKEIANVEAAAAEKKAMEAAAVTQQANAEAAAARGRADQTAAVKAKADEEAAESTRIVDALRAEKKADDLATCQQELVWPECTSTHVISYSLWGTHPLYLPGSLVNAVTVPLVYWGFRARVYVDDSVPADHIQDLKAAGAQVVVVPACMRGWGLGGMVWRFMTLDDPCVKVALSRDADSPITTREVAAVRKWLDSDMGVHSMHDNPYHNIPIMGGMWGVRTDALIREDGTRITVVDQLLRELTGPVEKGWDQYWLMRFLGPFCVGKTLVHSAFQDNHQYGEVHPFPLPRDSFAQFIGADNPANYGPDSQYAINGHRTFAGVQSPLTCRARPEYTYG